MKKIILTGLIVSILFSLTFVSAQEYICPMGGMMYGQYGYGLAAFSWIIGLLVIALIIATIYWLIKSANKKK